MFGLYYGSFQLWDFDDSYGSKFHRLWVLVSFLGFGPGPKFSEEYYLDDLPVVSFHELTETQKDGRVPMHEAALQKWWTAYLLEQEFKRGAICLKEINPEYSLEGLMLKLKLQYFGHLMQRANSLEKTLMLGNIEVRRRRGQQRMRLLAVITNSMTWVWANSRSWWRMGKPDVLRSMGSQRIRHDLMTEQQ